METNTHNDIRFNILSCAHDLFLENGYESTSLSLIAYTLGIENNTLKEIFSNKTELVCDIFKIIGEYINSAIQKNYDHRIDPLTYCAANIEAKIRYLYSSDYHDLFMKALATDEYLIYLTDIYQKTLEVVLNNENIELNDDYKLLYGILIPYAVEKNLFLGIESGEFTTIKFEEIVSYMMHTRFERWIAYDTIDLAVEKAKPLALLINSTMANRITNKEFAYYYTQAMSK